MQKFTRSLIGTNRRAFLLIFVISALTVFGVIAWQASAKQGKDRLGSSDGESGGQTITLGSDSRFPGYDIRTAKNGEGDQFLETARSRANRTASSAADIRDAFVRGEEALRARIPHVKFEYNDSLRIPEVITPDVWSDRFEFLSAPSTVKRPTILRNFVKQNNELVGIDDQQADSLKVSVDATNPDGNISYAYLEQRINDIPVFRGEIKAGFSRNGQLLRVINNLAPGLDKDSLSTDFGDPAAAVRAAAGHIDHALKIDDQSINLSKSSDLKAVFGDDDWATTAEKMYFPMEPGVAVTAWRVLIWEPVNAYYVIVDAQTGTMLWRKNITAHQTQSATYQVYNNTNAYLKSADSPAPLSPGPVDPTTGTQGVVGTRTNVTLIGNEGVLAFNNEGWITDGNNTTDGNHVEAGVDRVAPNGVDAVQTGSPNRVFDSTWIPAPAVGAAADPTADAQSQRGAVIQMFYVMNRYHDTMYQLGFTEPFFNFQANNFGRGGSGGDRVSAEGQDNTLNPPACPVLPCANNANFSSPADGNRGRMQMYIWTGPNPDYDGTADAEVIIHEATHGTSNRLHGNSSGLNTNMSDGMGEGWSDFYAESMLAEPTDPINGIYTVGGYATYLASGGFNSNYYHGIRRFPRAPLTFLGPNGRPHNPFTFQYVNSNCNTLIGTTSTNPNSAYPRGPFGSNTCDQVHNLGEIWSSMLWEGRNRMVARLGFTSGTTRMLQAVTDGMKLAPVGPTFLQERDAILVAATAISAADADDIREGFRVRGAGQSASIQNAGTGSNDTAVTEAYDPLLGTTTTVTGSPNPSKFGAPVTITATVTGPGSTPLNLGSVTFIEGGTCAAPGTTLSGPTPINAIGQAAFSTTSLSVASHTITACYGQFMGWAASSGNFVQVVAKADTTTTLVSSVNPSFWGEQVTFTATLSITSPGAGTPTGNISFRDNAVNIGTCAAQVVSANVASCSISTLSVGNHPITAIYNGDGSFNASPVSNPVSQTVIKANTTTALATSVSPSVWGQTVTFTATISVTAPGAGTPTGNVTFKNNGVDIATCAAQVVAANIATCSISTLAVGSHPITALYNGDGNFNASPLSNTIIQVVNKADTLTTITTDLPDPSVYGGPVTVNYTVVPVPPGAGTPTGNVVVTVSGGAETCTGTVAAGSCVITLTAVGPRTLTATYAGDTNFNGSNDTEPHLVIKANTTTAIVSDLPDPTVYGQNYTVTTAVAPVAPGAGTPTGNVTVSDGTNACVAILPATSCSLPSTLVGGVTLTATYSGDGNFNGSVSATASHTVNKADTTTIVQTAQNAPTYGQSTTITASLVSNAPGSGVPQGAVNFLDGASPITACQNVALNALGSAACSLNTLGAGTHTITVNYLGNANFNTSSGSAQQTVLKAALNITASSHNVTYGDAVPTITPTFSGFVLGESSANLTTQPTCSTTYTQGAGAAASPYPTSCSGAVSANYAFNYIGGSINVAKKALTVTADNKSKAYGAANPALTATLSGFIGADNAANSTTGTAGLSTTATATSPVGSYPITATVGTLASGNYSFATFNPGTLTVTAVQLTVTANNQTRVYGAPNPTLTYSITGFVNGDGVGSLTGTPTISTAAGPTSAPGTYPISLTIGSLASPNYGFTLVGGTLTVTQAATTTTITNAAALGNPTSAGQSYAVNWTTSPVAPATGTPTGNVTVSDGTATCTAAVGAGTCNLTSTTSGTKTITATYAGDTNFTGSTSQSVQHNVVNGLTGNVKQFIALGTNTNLAGITMTLLNTGTQQAVTTTTDASGNYSFSTSLGQSYMITPSGLGKVYEATSRTYTNVAGNISGADFIAYDVPGPNAIPRSARVSSQIATQGQPVTVPVLITTSGVETRVSFSVEYPTGPLGVPTVTCGTGAVNCTLTVDNLLAGKVGITVTPANSNPLPAGTRELVKITFPTQANPATSAAIKFGDFPTTKDVRNAENNPLPMLYWTDGLVSFTGGTLLDGATLSGRVLNANGQGVRNATVTIVDPVGNRRTAVTGSFGNYQFENLELGRDYMLVVTSKRYRFATRTVNLTENLSDVNLVGLE